MLGAFLRNGSIRRVPPSLSAPFSFGFLHCSKKPWVLTPACPPESRCGELFGGIFIHRAFPGGVGGILLAGSLAGNGLSIRSTPSVGLSLFSPALVSFFSESLPRPIKELRVFPWGRQRLIDGSARAKLLHGFTLSLAHPLQHALVGLGLVAIDHQGFSFALGQKDPEHQKNADDHEGRARKSPAFNWQHDQIDDRTENANSKTHGCYNPLSISSHRDPFLDRPDDRRAFLFSRPFYASNSQQNITAEVRA